MTQTPPPPPLYEEGLRSSPAALRNRAPILKVLRQYIAPGQRVLEIASGTGEHAAHFAQESDWYWQCSDALPQALETIAHWTRGVPGIAAPPLHLDMMDGNWPARATEGGSFDAIYCANMIHIAPPEAMTGLIAGAQRVLTKGGLLLLYGPFRIGAYHTAPSNADFDASLKARDPRWGLRDLGEVVDTMRQHQLVHQATQPMPANNLCLIFERRAASPARLHE
ncbi:MAG: DUF938 domain-containing protein [Pseudomonadota bacterium]